MVRWCRRAVNRSFLSFFAACRTPANRWDTLHPALSRERAWLVSVLLDQRPSLLTLRRQQAAIVRVIHRYYATVRLLKDVHAGRAALAFSRRSAGNNSCRHLRGLPVLVHEVSRRALGSSTTQDWPATRANVAVHVAFRHTKSVSVLITSFRSSIAQPTYTPVYASPCSSRNTTQNSGPSGSLLLPRKNLSFSTSCRFIPAHGYRHLASNPDLLDRLRYVLLPTTIYGYAVLD